MGEASGADTWGIFGAVPLSTRKNAKSGEQGTQLACGSNKCPLSSNAFSRAPRGSQPPKSGASVPEASSTLCTGMTGGCFCPVGTKRRGSLWKSKKYLEFFKRYCYGENLYVKILFESFNRLPIISLDVLICRYIPLFRAFPALFISEEPHKSFYYPSCFRSQK